MKPSSDSIDPRVRELLQQLTAPPRDAPTAQQRRAEFLAQAEALRQTLPARPRESLGALRLRLSMSALTAAIVALVLVIGATAMVSAAQDALPTDPLYAVKILSEDVRVHLAGDAPAQVDLLLDFANRRTDEVIALGASGAAGGAPIAERVIARQQAQIENALRIAASMDDAGMSRELTRVRDNVARQLQTIETAPVDAPAASRAQTLLEEQRVFAEMGLNDPAAFRARIRERARTTPTLPAALPRPLTVPATRTLPRAVDSPTAVHPTRPSDSPQPPTATRLPPPTGSPPPPTIPATSTARPLPTQWQTPPAIPTRPTQLPTPLPTHNLPPSTPPPTIRPTLPPAWTPPLPPAWTPPRPPGWTPPAPPAWTPQPRPTRVPTLHR